MKIKVSEGCTAFYTEIDGKIVGEEDERYSTELVREHINCIIEHLIEEYDINTVVTSLVKEYGEIVYEDDEPCESCGDYVTQWELEIKGNK